MSLDVQNLIAHRIDKERHGSPELDLRDELLPVDDQALEFVDALHKHYSSSSKKTYGVFDSEQPPGSFEDHMSEHLSNGVHFLDFSRRAMTKLKDTISGGQMATGGYVVFAHYTTDISYLTCLMLRNTASFAFTERMNLRLMERLEMKHLRHGSSIDLDKWLDGKKAHLSFITSQDKTSNYFQEWVGCTTTTSSTEANQNLRRAVKDYIDNLTIPEDEKARRTDMLLDLSKSCKSNNATLRLEQVAQIMNPNQPEDFVTFASSPNYAVDSEISPRPRILKPIAYVSYEGEGYKLEIKQDLLQRNIFEWREEENQLVMNDVPHTLAEKLRDIGA